MDLEQWARHQGPPPPCDCGHAFSQDPDWFHLGVQCAFWRWRHPRVADLIMDDPSREAVAMAAVARDGAWQARCARREKHWWWRLWWRLVPF